MSPKAILRRQCKRAMRQLIARFGYKADDFEIPEGDNSMDVLPGTPIYWYRSSYECEEYDCKTAADELQQIKFVDFVDWSKIAEMDRLRDRYKAMREYPEQFRLNVNRPEAFEEHLAKEWGSTLQFCSVAARVEKPE